MLKFFYSAVFIIIIVVLIFFGFSFYNQKSSGPAIEFSGPESVIIGQPFELSLKINNDSDQIFQDVKISLKLPKGIALVGQSPENNLISKKLGNLGVGSLTGESFQLIALADLTLPSDLEIQKTITASIDYSPEFLGTRFAKEVDWQLAINGSAIELAVAIPSDVISGQELKMDISYLNASDFDFADLYLTIEYPPTFQYGKATIEPDIGNNQWQLGGLRGGSKNNFSILGALIGPENNLFDFLLRFYAKISDHKYLIHEQKVSSAIQLAPLSLAITANDSRDYVAGPNETLRYRLDYHYLEETAINSSTITAKLIGEMFNYESVRVDGGVFDAVNRTVTWKINDGSLSGSVNFEVKVKESYPIKRLGDRNFILKVEAAMTNERFTTIAESLSKIAGYLEIIAQGFFRDAEGGIVNSGPFPPQAGQNTQFSIHWLLINYSTDTKNIVVKAKLAENISFTKKIKTSSGEFSFNEDLREIVWEVNRISATKGIIGNPTEAIFQITATPPADLIGQFMPLIELITVSATDEFTGISLNNSAAALTTELSSDPTVKKDEGRVGN